METNASRTFFSRNFACCPAGTTTILNCGPTIRSNELSWLVPGNTITRYAKMIKAPVMQRVILLWCMIFPLLVWQNILYQRRFADRHVGSAFTRHRRIGSYPIPCCLVVIFWNRLLGVAKLRFFIIWLYGG